MWQHDPTKSRNGISLKKTAKTCSLHYMSQRVLLVTGGAGFIGSHLVARLVQEGNRVISLDNYFTGNRESQCPGVEYREGHTKNIRALVREEVDMIYHLGEYARVEQSLAEPDVVWDLNVAGTFAVLEYWRAINYGN